MATTTYLIHSTVRARHNRTLRAVQPTRHRFKQYVGDGQKRLIRGRPIAFTEEEFQRHLPDLKAKQASGILEVRTAAGEVIDLETLTPKTGAPPPPLPKPPLDSIARDVPWGQEIPPFPGDEVTLPSGQEPSLVSDLDRGAREEEDARAGTQPSIGPDPHDEEDAGAFADARADTQPSIGPDLHDEEDVPHEDVPHGTATKSGHPHKSRKGKR